MAVGTVPHATHSLEDDRGLGIDGLVLFMNVYA